MANEAEPDGPLRERLGVRRGGRTETLVGLRRSGHEQQHHHPEGEVVDLDEPERCTPSALVDHGPTGSDDRVVDGA